MNPAGLLVRAPHDALAGLLTPDAREFLVAVHEEFEPERRALLQLRTERQNALLAGRAMGFLPATQAVRSDEWRVAEPPADLRDRRVEITGPATPKMMINALNSGAKVFMADLEDSLAPSWHNVVSAQLALRSAVRRDLKHVEAGGKSYALRPEIATLVVRPRGWHLVEKHVSVGGEPISASLFDAALYLFHNASELMNRGSGPYFYLPKLESHLEARLWNDVFRLCEEALELPRGSIRPTVLIETITAAFEMDEILFELRERICGLNAGRWDYIFSVIKKLHHDPRAILPDRAQVTMTVPFMLAYVERLVDCCHRRGAHAIGGMSAFIPKRGHDELNDRAFGMVREDKRREARQGFDGTWVAHPDLVPIAMQEFDAQFGAATDQKQRRPTRTIGAGELLDLTVPDGRITEAGVRNNISVGLQYLAALLAGHGAVAIFNLMEDAATAEIARAQLWQWMRYHVPLDGGHVFDEGLYRKWRDQELRGLGEDASGWLAAAAALLDELVMAKEFPEFLTLPAYELLD